VEALAFRFKNLKIEMPMTVHFVDSEFNPPQTS
jgi:hypothetical protein